MIQWGASFRLSSRPRSSTAPVAKPLSLRLLRSALLITLGIAIGFYVSQRYGTRCYLSISQDKPPAQPFNL